MRVLMSTPYDLAVPGGVNEQALGLLDALHLRGISARLIGPASESIDTRNGRIEVLGRVSTLGRNGAVSRVTFDFKVLGQIRRILREFEPTIIHVQEPVVPLIGPALLALAPKGVRRVGTFHTYSEQSFGYLWAWPWCRWLWSRLDQRIAVSGAAREFATRYHSGTFGIVPNGVVEPPHNLARSFKRGRLRLLFVGRMDEPRKGFGVVLSALRCLSPDDLKLVELTAVGRGSEPWKIQTNGLPVVFRGELDDAGREQALAQADALVLPSIRGESFGVVGLEAMIRGLPVIAARLPAYADWMRDAAMYFSPNHEQELADVICQLVHAPELLVRLSTRGEKLSQSYRWEKLIERWLAVYGDSEGSKEAKLA